MRRLFSFILVIAFMSGACSGSGPSGPSPVPAPPAPASSSGATIAGSFGAATGGGTVSTSSPGTEGGPATGIEVAIAGTSISATVNGNGRFVLTNAPDGTITLQFSGAGITGTITLTNVASGQTIELTLQLAGSTVALAGERRSSGKEEQVEGQIEAFPAAPAGALVVAGRTITTDVNTRILMGSQTMSFGDLAIGQRVHVKGQPDNGTLLASLIDIQNDNTTLPVNVNGLVTSLGVSNTAALFEFTVGGTLVKGDATTEFYGGSVYTDLIASARVEVKGRQGTGFVQALRIHVNTPDDDDDDDDEAEFTGVLTAKTGAAPTLTLTIGGTTVTTTAATEVRRRGDNLTFDALQVGQTIDVSGTTQPGGSIVAKKLTIESGATDVDLEGAVSGPVTGACPAITFMVGGVTFTTTSFTEFKKTSCAAIVTGANVKVRGVMTGAATAQATRVEIEN